MSHGGAELPPVAADRLERFFDKVERMTDAEFVMLRAVWEEADETDREMAWGHVRRIANRRKLGATLDDARARLSAWVNNYMPMSYVGTSLGFSGMDPAQIRHLALPPLMDAVAAIITSNDLEARQQTLLLEPMSRLSPHMR